MSEHMLIVLFAGCAFGYFLFYIVLFIYIYIQEKRGKVPGYLRMFPNAKKWSSLDD